MIIAFDREQTSPLTFASFSALIKKLNSHSNLEEALKFLVEGLLRYRGSIYAVVLQHSRKREIEVIEQFGLASNELREIKSQIIDSHHPIAMCTNTKEILHVKRQISKSEEINLEEKSTLYLPLEDAEDCSFALVVGFSTNWEIQEVESAFFQSVSEVFSLHLIKTGFSGVTRIKPDKDSIESINLSERQKRIAIMIAEGMTNTSIARRLGFSEATIRYETIKLYERLRVKNRAQAAATIRELFH